MSDVRRFVKFHHFQRIKCLHILSEYCCFVFEINQNISKDHRHEKITSLVITACILHTNDTQNTYVPTFNQTEQSIYVPIPTFHLYIKFICTFFYTNLSPRPNTPRAYNSISSLNETHDTTKTRNEVN